MKSLRSSADSSFNHAINSNQIQINDYNYLRKSKTFYELNNRQNINNIRNNSYRHLGYYLLFLFLFFFVTYKKNII